MPNQLQKASGTQAGVLRRGLSLAVTMTTVICSFGMTQIRAEDNKLSTVKLTDLAAFPSWREHEICSGAVKRYVDSDSIANIILVRAISNATPDLWFAVIRHALSEDREFIADPHEGRWQTSSDSTG